MSIRWSPDTCGCVLLVDHDWSNPRAEKLCERHAATGFQGAHDDNTHKNKSIAAIKELFPDKYPDEKQPDWSFDKDGALNVVVEGTAEEKKDAAGHAALTVGKSVKIV